MKSYVFKVDLEPDEEGWRAFYPPLEELGASTWGLTQNEALKNIQEVLSMIVDELTQEGETIPDNDRLTVSEGAAVTVIL